ncbi:hypothetical protein ACT17_32755 [Mycolicibacterium conceptionense]|uniref:Uncharacterized protein n=1 Tax=Mycolicibacterium conceptionense TaxID=451644 RepID=A0A0J8TX33_9MYCO|nr:hypothetical protein [Mycolicibacterium conceptionense]KMV13953.1 hypothetical protein ACT17_32755 [Mycolicibacterium conceptionense]
MTEERLGQSWTHVLAVLAGAARPDNDVYAHFGSLLGFNQHATVARNLGLVLFSDDGTEIVLTPAGREFAERFRLSEAPAGRANYWGELGFGAEAEAELERLWEGRG